MGLSHQEIGRPARVSQPTLRRYLADYQAGGLDQLKVVNVYRPTGDLNKYRTTLKNARYQHCRRVIELAAQLGIELLFLPPYSPNPNLSGYGNS